MNMFKIIRQFTIFFVCFIVFSAVVLTTSASALSLSVSLQSSSKTKAILVAGDAISSGKGLDDRAGKSYGSLLAAQFGVTGGKYNNIAEDYMSSSAFLELLTYLQLDVEGADTMIISLGIDDIMPIITDAIEMTAGGDMTYSKLLSYAADAEYIKSLNEAIDHTAIFNATAKYSVNISEIINRIRRYNPDIRIVFLSLYNPLDGAESLISLKNIFSSPVDMMNNALNKATEESGCNVINLKTAFAGQANKLTNLTSLDVSPNAEGHKIIASLLADYISALPDLTEETTPDVTTAELDESLVTDTQNTPETTLPPSDYKIPLEKSHLWIYILIAAGVSGAGIVIGSYSVKNRKKKN